MKQLNSVVFAQFFATAIAIPFNPEWSECGGYFAAAVYDEAAPVLELGQLRSSVAPDGRKLLILGTALGNVVVFQRYYDNEETFAKNTTMEMEKHFGKIEFIQPRLTADNIQFIFSQLNTRLAELPVEELTAMRERHAAYLVRRQRCVDNSVK